MATRDLPETAAWEHRDAQAGFEVLFIEGGPAGWRFVGQTSAVEDGAAWTVGYSIDVDAEWRTRSALIWGRSPVGESTLRLESDGAGHWRADGIALPPLDGCPDVDLEASAFTNTLPARRMRLGVGAGGEAPAAYVRAVGLGVERLEQRYTRLPDGADGERYDYESPSFGFRCELTYDEAGLTLDYPGIARRVL